MLLSMTKNTEIGVDLEILDDSTADIIDYEIIEDINKPNLLASPTNFSSLFNLLVLKKLYIKKDFSKRKMPRKKPWQSSISSK